jgi:L-iditol 2-dehydrogenase
MRAAFLVGPRQLELRAIPDPTPSAGGLVLDVKACNICGSDLRRWKEGPPTSAGIIPGHEIAGVVSEVGAGVTDFSVQDRLAVAPDIHCGRCYYCRRGMYNLCDHLRLVGITPGYPGGFADRMLLSREILENGIVHAVPPRLPLEAAALAEPCSSVLAAHDSAHTSLGDTILVMGAGPIGCLHVVVARARGATVIVSEPNPTRRELVQSFHPAQVIDPTAEDLFARVADLTDGVGVDVVICANPVAETQGQAVQVVRKAGHVVLFGGLPKADPSTVLDGNRIHYGEITIAGSFSYHPRYHKLALDLLAQGVIPAATIVTHTFDLGAITEAFETAASGRGLKVVVRP